MASSGRPRVIGSPSYAGERRADGERGRATELAVVDVASGSVVPLADMGGARHTQLHQVLTRG